MPHYHYANKNNETTGPLSYSELLELAANGTLDDDSPVIEEGSASWSKWSHVKAAHARRDPHVPDPTAATAEMILAATQGVRFGSVLFALLMILIELWVMPARLFMRAMKDLSDWGASRRLPSSESEMPVVTYNCVVMRPVIHLLFTLIVFVIGASQLTGPSWNRPPLWLVLLATPLLAYFGQIVVSLVFENLGLVVRTANNLATIARNSATRK